METLETVKTQTTERHRREVLNERMVLFRKTAGDNIETILLDEQREMLRATQQEVMRVLDAPREELEKAYIVAKVESFFKDLGLDKLQKIIAHLSEKVEELEKENDSTRELLTKEMFDDTTGLLKKKYLMSFLQTSLAAYRREADKRPIPYTIIFFDLDKFKEVNDTYGHLAGDAVLEMIGRKVNEIFQRESDIKGRYAGDEFMLVMPQCNSQNAHILAEKLRKEIENTPVLISDNGFSFEIKVTISLGVLTAVLEEKIQGTTGDLIRSLISETDSLMYNVKRQGRNSISAKEVNFGRMPDPEGVLT
ncbi:GGDEF domain-containing protein [Candidatus Peregrinibacteria bacterium]|nr:GGDEF domain-containing protein [Candidatus Peregrinibacteria bacterium]